MVAAAIIPRIPYIHGTRLTDLVVDFDCARLLDDCPAPVVVPLVPGLYPLPEPEFDPELEPRLGSCQVLDRSRYLFLSRYQNLIRWVIQNHLSVLVAGLGRELCW